MIHHGCGVANPPLRRLLIGVVAGAVITLIFQELYRRVRAAVSYQIAKRYGRWVVARERGR